MKQLLSKQNKLKCQICGRKVSTYTSKICIKCLAITSKGKNNHNYKNGKHCKNYVNRCINCNRKISNSANRCRVCANKQHKRFMSGRFTGKKNFGFKHGLSKNKIQYNKFRINTDINYRLKKRLRSRLSTALKRNSKSKSTLKLLGCTIQKLKQHLENRFKKRMTWNNYGFYGWHIDHIRPCFSFDLSKAKEQRKCFHYTNLQPLWAKENYRKRKTDKEIWGKVPR